jgi:hypothetical protein
MRYAAMGLAILGGLIFGFVSSGGGLLSIVISVGSLVGAGLMLWAPEAGAFLMMGAALGMFGVSGGYNLIPGMLSTAGSLAAFSFMDGGLDLSRPEWWASSKTRRG